MRSKVFGSKFAFVILIAALAAFVWVYAKPAFGGEIGIFSGFWFGPLYIRMYGLLMAAGVFTSFLVARKFADRFGLTKERVEGALPWLVLGGLLGARLYYVAFSWGEPGLNTGLEILKIWEGGLAIYGALIGGVLALFFYTRRHGLPFWKMLDLAALAAPLGQSLGRWGNFFNQEAFGTPTNLPWGLYVPPAHRPVEYLFATHFHPAFLYESLWSIGVFLLLWFLLKRALSPGALAGTYLILYALGRYFIESLRLDSFVVGGLKIDQISSLLALLLGAFIIYRSYGKSNLENA